MRVCRYPIKATRGVAPRERFADALSCLSGCRRGGTRKRFRGSRVTITEGHKAAATRNCTMASSAACRGRDGTALWYVGWSSIDGRGFIQIHKPCSERAAQKSGDRRALCKSLSRGSCGRSTSSPFCKGHNDLKACNLRRALF